SAAAGLEQADTPQDQRPHDPLAELGLLDQEIAEPTRRDDDRGAVGAGDAVHECGPPGELRELAHERARAVDDDRPRRAARIALPDLDLALEHDDQAARDLAGPRESVPSAKVERLAETPHPLDLGGGERREALIAPGIPDRRRLVPVGHAKRPRTI